MQLNEEFAKFLDNYIEQKVRLIIQSEMNKYGNWRGWGATIDSVNLDGTINVIIDEEETEVISNLKNKSGQTLIANDEVYLSSISNLSNAFVSVAKNKP